MGGYLEGDVLPSWLRNVHTEHQTDTRVLPADVRLALPQLDVGVPELQDPDTVDSERVGGTHICVKGQRRRGDSRRVRPAAFSHCFHVVLWLQRDLQDFGAVDDLLKAGGRHRFAGDAVDLIEGVRLQDALIRRADEDLKAERLLASVAVQLKPWKQREKHRVFFGKFRDVEL